MFCRLEVYFATSHMYLPVPQNDIIQKRNMRFRLHVGACAFLEPHGQLERLNESLPCHADRARATS